MLQPSCLFSAIRWSIPISFLAIASTVRVFSQEIHQRFQVEKLPETINTPYDEIIPVPSRNGETLYFTRVGFPEFDRTLIFDTVNYALKLTEEKYMSMLGRLYGELGQTFLSEPWRSKFNQDIWYSQKQSDGQFGPPAHPPYPLNNALTNSLVSITPDPNAFYVLNQFKPEGDMKRGFSLVRKRDAGEWTFPQPVEIKDYYTITSEVNLTLSFDGKVMILSAARFDSKGLDLYICRREGENRWSAPINLGTVVNSSRREMTPFLSEDNRTLYFASDRSGGQLDIFMTRRQDDTWLSWSPPIELISPINSPQDESQPYFNMTSGFLYFTSKRDGNSDIFRVSIAPPQPTEIEVRGRVVNSQTREVIHDAEIMYGVGGDMLKGRIRVDQNGFSLKAPKGVPFYFSPVKAGFAGRLDSMYFRIDYYYFKEYYTIDLFLDPLQVNDLIQLQPVYFQKSDTVILAVSYPELARLSEIMLSSPDLHIRIEGHTDNVGSPESLLLLSQQRAERIRESLIRSGVEPNRIEAVGYGAKYPINENASDEMRSLNRRVEFRVMKN